MLSEEKIQANNKATIKTMRKMIRNQELLLDGLNEIKEDKKFVKAVFKIVAQNHVFSERLYDTATRLDMAMQILEEDYKE